MELMTLIITVIIALITCFFGFKFNKVIIALAGFVTGYQLCTFLTGGLIGNETATMVLSIVAGIALGIISFKLYLVGVFILCFVLTYILCQTFIDTESMRQVIGVIAGILVGALGVKFTKPIMIASTSFSGAFMLIDAVLTYFSFDNMFLCIVLSILLAFFGFGYQFNTNKDVKD